LLSSLPGRQREDDRVRAPWEPDRVLALRHVRRPNGGTPDGDLWHGMAVAQGDEVVVHSETFDINDPEVRQSLAGLDQHHYRVTDGEVTYGIVEPYDPLCYEVSKAGVMGFPLLNHDT
jgi:hypothetical protein